MDNISSVDCGAITMPFWVGRHGHDDTGVKRELPPMTGKKYIMSDFERAICSQNDVQYISRDSIDCQGKYVQFWSGAPRRITLGVEGVAYLKGPDGDLLFSLPTEQIDTRIKPGDCLRVLGDGLCKYVARGK